MGIWWREIFTGGLWWQSQQTLHLPIDYPSIFHLSEITHLSTTSFVNTKSLLQNTGLLCSWLTALSINGCERIKLSTLSGRVDVSLTHVPGRGSGIFELSTGNQAEFDVACSLNLPKREREMTVNKLRILPKGETLLMVIPPLNGITTQDNH